MQISTKNRENMLEKMREKLAKYAENNPIPRKYALFIRRRHRLQYFGCSKQPDVSSNFQV